MYATINKWRQDLGNPKVIRVCVSSLTDGSDKPCGAASAWQQDLPRCAGHGFLARCDTFETR